VVRPSGDPASIQKQVQLIHYLLVLAREHLGQIKRLEERCTIRQTSEACNGTLLREVEIGSRVALGGSGVAIKEHKWELLFSQVALCIAFSPTTVHTTQGSARR
jgi:hypothetical protein